MISKLLKVGFPTVALLTVLLAGLLTSSPIFIAYHTVTLCASIVSIRMLLLLMRRERDYHGYLLLQFLIGASFRFVFFMATSSFTLLIPASELLVKKAVSGPANLTMNGKGNGSIVLFGNSTDNMLANHTNASLQVGPGVLPNMTTEERKRHESVNSTVFFLFQHAEKIEVGYAGVIELTRIFLGSRYKLDSLPVRTPSLPFALVSFVAPDLGYQTMMALTTPLLALLMKAVVLVTRSPWKDYSKKVDAILVKEVCITCSGNFFFLPIYILRNLVFIATALLMAIAATRRFKYGRDMLLAFFAALAVRVLMSELQKRSPKQITDLLQFNLVNPIVVFLIQLSLLFILLFVAQMMHLDVKKYFQLQFRRLRFFLVSKRERSNEAPFASH